MAPNGRATARRGFMDDIKRAIELLRSGTDTEQSFRTIFDCYYLPVQRFFAKRVFSAEDRLDLTQETFLRVYKGIGGFRGEAQFGTWLFRIAHNTYLKWLRKVDRPEIFIESEDGEEFDNGPASPAPDPLDKAMGRQRQLVVRQAVAELPDQMRRCAQLRLEQDLSYREIASAMRLSIETVKVHLFQARKKLKESLGDIDF